MTTPADKLELSSRSTAAALLLLLDGLDRKDGKRLARRLVERVVADVARDQSGAADPVLTTPAGSNS